MKQPRPDDKPASRLDEIPTQWTLLHMAHRDSIATSAQARNALVLRYARAIRNYVGALIQNDQDADEVAQEVVLRLLRGQFANATPERGSFRRLLMVATHNLVRNYWSRQQRQPEQDVDLGTVADDAATSALEADALAQWKQSLLDLAWQALAEYERTHQGSVTYTLLRLRAENPDDDSEQLARRLSEKIGKPFRADAARQQLRRARLRFAQALLEEVARGLDEPTPANVEEELAETGLLPFVQDLLPADWKQKGALRE